MDRQCKIKVAEAGEGSHWLGWEEGGVIEVVALRKRIWRYRWWSSLRNSDFLPRLCPRDPIILYAITFADYDQDGGKACKKLMKTKEGIESIALYSTIQHHIIPNLSLRKLRSHFPMAPNPNPKRAPPKKPPPKPQSPSPSSSSSGDDSDPQSPRPTNNPSQSSPEDDQQSTPKPKKHPSSAENQQAGSDLSSGDDSDSDSPPALEKSTSSRRPDPSIKPISSKPMAESPKSKKLSTPAPKSGENHSNAPDAVEPESTIRKLKLFERFWSEGDEIKILEGVAEYYRKKGTDPASVVDLDSLHKFMKSFLGSEFDKNQLGRKIRRLKNRFWMLHAKNNGNPNITKPHERAKYELSKKIWGQKKSLIDEAEDDGDEDEDAGNSSEHETVKQSSRKSRKRKDPVDNGNSSEHETVKQSSRKSQKRKDPVDNGVLNDGSNRTKEVDDYSYEYIMEAFGQMKNDIFSDMFLEQGLKLADPKKAKKLKKLDQEFRELSMLEAKSNLEYISIVRDIASHTLEALQKSG